MKKLTFVSVFLLAIFFYTPAHAVVINYNVDGDWIGLENFEFDGTLYDVEFATGTVDSVFGNSSELTFNNSSDANTATGLLMSFRLNNIPMPSSPSDPDVTLANGCDAFSCYFLTPYFFDSTTLSGAVHDISWDTFDPEGGYLLGGSGDGINRTFNAGGNSTVWVVFTPTAVPIPGAFWLFSSGILVLFGAVRNRIASR